MAALIEVSVLGQIDLYFPPEFLKAALILALLSVWVLVGLYSYLNRYTRRRYFTVWTAAWLFYALWLTLAVRFHPTAPGPLGVMLQQWCIGAAAVCLLWGSALFLGQREPQRLYGLFCGFLLVWGYVGAFHLGGGLQVSLPTFGILAGASFWTAWGYVRLRRRQAYVGASLLAFAFCVWGVYLVAFAFLQFDPYQVSSLYFLSGVVQMFVAVSMIVLTLEESREQLARLEQEIEGRRGATEELNQALEGKTDALKASEARFRTLAEAAPVGILETDADGQPVFSNSRWRELLSGACRAGEAADSWTDAVHREDREEIRDLWARAMGIEEPFSREFRLSRGDGQLWVLGQATLLRDSRNRVDGCLLTMSDIDGLKQAEARRRSLESQLRQSQKMETLGTLAGGVAHGFNNLLQPILGFARLAEDSLEEGHEAREDLEYVFRAATRATELVKQMLMFSRQVEHERMPLLMPPLIGEALKLLRGSLPSNVRIESEISADCPPVMADATQIHQVVMNLCANAYHAVRENNGSIRVELKPIRVTAAQAAAVEGLREGEYAMLEVSDTGSGMDGATTERVFDPFFTTKRGGQGTGLGLSVVHGVVLGHDGAVEVESEQGKGSVFRVYLPGTALEIPEEKKTALLPRGDAEHILFVDDEREVAMLGKKMLERLGYRITLATSSLEARRLFADRPEEFDLVITDQMMPDLTGDRLALDMLDARANIPIIMITGFAEKMTAEDSRRIGIREFMLKPVGMDDLGRTVRRVLDESRAV